MLKYSLASLGVNKSIAITTFLDVLICTILYHNIPSCNESQDNVIYFGTKRNRRRGVVEKLYTIKEVLEMLRISRTTLYRHIDNGLIKPLKLGGKVLFAESELDRLLQRAKGEENQIEGGNQKVLQNSVKSLNPDESRRLDLAKAARVARAQRVKKKK